MEAIEPNFFDEYVEWTDTVAKYPVTAEAYYLALGIADEVAEVFQAATPEETLKELGDVMWYLSRYCKKVLGLPLSYILSIGLELQEEYLVVAEVGRIAGVEKKRIRDGHLWNEETKRVKEGIALNAAYTLIQWVEACAGQQGYTFEEVLIANQGKLNKRNENNTIQGDGDNR